MPNSSVGSVWRKWDLHVHSPDSFYQNYPGSEKEAWEAFLSDLEALPAEFKVIGINDYVLVDGYEKVLKAKSEGRLQNIDLILPVVELRLDKFGGTVRDDGSGSSWSRINLHVIFDQVDPQLIREQFISAISSSYKLLPGSVGKGGWSQIITRTSIEALGRAIIESVPEDKRGKFRPPLVEGFNNLCVSMEAVADALRNEVFHGKHVLAVGKTEWEDLKWTDHTIAEKKTLINCAQLVFTAAESPERYEKGRAMLRKSGVNDRLLDCSDADWLSTASDKDRLGNCYTWIKADCTFAGLLQAIEEFDGRVFVGNVPPKLDLVQANKTKFIDSVTVQKKRESELQETWFDVDLPLNGDLVAIIGNKGSGKSALSDIIALAGGAQNFAKFSFLRPERFRSAKGRLASQFCASLKWRDGTTTSIELDKDPAPSGVERVKYLPQSYLEDLCNELGRAGSETFDAELRKIIYSHVPDEERLGQPSMDQLPSFKVAEIDKARDALRQKISTLNAQILDVEHRSSPDFKKMLEERLATKISELQALELAGPQEVEDPNASAEALEESKAASAEIDRLEQASRDVDLEVAAERQSKASAVLRLAVAKKSNRHCSTFNGRVRLLLQSSVLSLRSWVARWTLTRCCEL